MLILLFFIEPGVIDKTLPFICPANYVQCLKERYCIPVKYVCDGKWHCPDGEDEMECGMCVITIYSSIQKVLGSYS